MKDDERGQRREAEKMYSCAIDVALQTVGYTVVLGYGCLCGAVCNAIAKEANK